MRKVWVGMIVVLALAGCAVSQGTTVPVAEDARLAAAEAFIDAFYSFDAARLKAVMASAEKSLPEVGFYQGWAEGGNYRILKRDRCTLVSANEAQCAITVKDDLIPALGLDLNVTDTFHLTFSGDKIVSVRTTSNDPPVFQEALQWIGREKPGVLEGPCRGFFDGGPTPGDCVRVVVQGFREFTAKRTTPSPSGR